MKVNNLKLAWINNEIPKVKKGIFGDTLSAKNISIKEVGKENYVLVGDIKSGRLEDKKVVDYFMQFVGYPDYRHYVLDTLKVLDRLAEIK